MRKKKLCFCVGAIADLYAARGLITALRIRPGRSVIAFDQEADEAMTRRIFPGYTLERGWRSRPDRLRIRFDTYGRPGFRGGELVFDYAPYKYFFKRSGSWESGGSLRRAMRVEHGRKIIVCSASTRDEVKEILKAYGRLAIVPRPLLVLGLRQPDPFLKGVLLRMGVRAAWRMRRDQGLSLLGRTEVVVLNTAGELSGFLGASDLALMGHDRNLFEPAVLGVPILYFNGPLKISPKMKKLMKLFGLAWRNNRMAKRLLDAAGGARRIRPAFFAGQITQALDHPEEMVRGAREAVRKLNEEVLPEARRRGAFLLAEALGEAEVTFR